jgi:hypothetical protein
MPIRADQSARALRSATPRVVYRLTGGMLALAGGLYPHKTAPLQPAAHLRPPDRRISPSHLCHHPFVDTLAPTPIAIPCHRFKAKTSTPAPTIRMPSHSRTDGRSWRNSTANTATSTMLSLSTGATFEASPTFKARK